MRDPRPAPNEEPGCDSRFAIRTREEIVEILRGAIERRAPVSVHPENDAGPVRTTLIAADAARGELVFELPRRLEETARLMSGPRLHFVTSDDGIRLEFEAPGATVRLYRDHPALASPLPETLLRLQRREFFRFPTPLAERPLITVADSCSDAPAPLQLAVIDLSQGGVSLLDRNASLRGSPRQRFPNSRIALPQSGDFGTTLELCGWRDITLRDGRALRYVGCKFVALDSSALGLLHRYILRLQRTRGQRFRRR